jgi:hypothetical protein
VKILRDREKIGGNIIKVGHDGDTVNLIYIQLARQREIFKKFGQMLQLDGTYKINRHNFPLYTLVVRNNFGIGEPVACCFMKNETTESVTEFLRIFSSVCSLIISTIV